MTAEVFNIQRFSLFDGPGVRTVVFLKGCPLRCVWCHNPEGGTVCRQIMYNADRCMGCTACVQICPNGCHRMEDGQHIYDRSRCTACGKCARECFSLALTQVGRTMTVEEILQIVLRDQKNYDASGGGLTLSGGEPLMHGDFSAALLKAAKEKGLHTCVETSGYGDPEKLRQLAAYTDLFLFDYKITGDKDHLALCGVPQTPILENLALLDTIGASVVLRCPLIPEHNGTRQHQEGIADAVNRFRCIGQVHIEPYHRLGISKSQQLGLKPDYEADVPEKEFVDQFAAGLQAICADVPVQVN